MISGVLSLKVTPCANGETFEYRLFCENRQVGESRFLLGPDQAEKALGRIFAHLIEDRHKG
jgi:hypothetical protein